METREVLNETRETARQMLGERQQAAAGTVGEFAGTLRRAARESGDNSAAGRVAASAADTLESFAESLRAKDLDSFLRDAESFARRQPLAFIGAAAVVGYFAVRFLKASDPARQENPRINQTTSPLGME